ncbi:MAG: hypothetical protein K2L34_07945 [Muribaculaceae bacterium]|nr:hypothetical protein [Muribaculaceae bacterium]
MENFTTSYTYDRQANLKTIKRKGKLVGGTYGDILDVTFKRDGNKLISVTGKNLSANPLENQSSISGNIRSLTYNVNGNLTADGTRAIRLINYNDIDKPSTIYFTNGDRVSYTYTASGRKLAEEYSSADNTINRVRQLIGSFELVNGSLDRIQTGSGYLTSQGTYNLFIPDYQGNVVGVYDTSQKKLIQTTDYYPYGLPMITSTGAEVNRRKFGSKEYSTEFGLNESDFEARRFVPVWGGFSQPDPKSIDYPQFSPWAYCAGDPINVIDKYGEDLTIVGANKSSLTFTANCINATYNISALGLDFKGNYQFFGDEALSIGLDIAGCIDPTGLADFTNAGIYYQSGHYKDAAISVAAAFIPYVGDFAKLVRDEKILDKVTSLIRRNSEIGNLAEKCIHKELIEKYAGNEYSILSQISAKFNDGKRTRFDFVVVKKEEIIENGSTTIVNRIDAIVEVKSVLNGGIAHFTKNQEKFFIDKESIKFVGGRAEKGGIIGVQIESPDNVTILPYKLSY